MLYTFSGMAHHFISKYQPKVLFIFATFSTALAMMFIGIYVFLQKQVPDLPYLDTFSWIPLFSLIISVIVRSIGMLPVIYLVMSEVFPTEIRTQSIGICESFAVASGTFCIKYFPEMKNGLGLHGLFLFYGATGVVACLWGLVSIPDNRGKSLIKVEEMYEEKRNQDKTVKMSP